MSDTEPVGDPEFAIDAGLPVRAFFTTRDGGVSTAPYTSLNVATHVGDDPVAVAANRDQVSRWAGAPVSFLVAEHGVAVAQIDAPGEQPGPADALVTARSGVAIAAIAADCAPVLMHDSATGAVAAVHAGREGLYEGVIDAAVNALFALRGSGSGVSARGVLSASIGPTICGRCYEVPSQMRERVASRHPAAFATTRAGTPALDLPRAIAARLDHWGCDPVIASTMCTAESARLFSHRRDGVTGRIAGAIVCE